MQSAMTFSMLAAALLVSAGAFFGVITTRVLWADDLKQAQRIDEIRSQTEKHLRGQIDALQEQITLLRK